MTNASDTQALITLAERSAFRKTGRTDEVERLCAVFAQTWPDRVRSFEYGRSAEGRSMRALLVAPAGVDSPEALRSRGLPLLMLQGGIHPGESDGKDAGFIALRELLVDRTAPGILDKLAILFVPAFNVDGHERFGRWNRPNQNGPEEMGWRSTAQNINLNRDYTKADAPEMQAMLRLLADWDPLVCADMHVTDGADFEPDISIQVEPVHQGDAHLFPCAIELRDELIAKLAAAGSLPLSFYPDLAETDDPASGFQVTVYSPRFSTGYFPARNRFAVLVETHSWKPYETRVRLTRHTIVGLIELTVAHGARWLDEVQRADARAQEIGGSDVALNYEGSWREPMMFLSSLSPGAADAAAGADGAPAVDANVTLIDFPGYAYTRERSEISGDLVTVYHPGTPQIWRVPLRRYTSPTLIVTAPRGGYIVLSGHAAELGRKLRLHGIELEPFETTSDLTPVEVFRATHTEFSRGPVEGRMRLRLEGSWKPERQRVPEGSLFVPIKQARSRLLMTLLEPQAVDSFAAWGFLNGCFEEKEYVEPYVAEQIARELLAGNPDLAMRFRERLAHDSEFAASPQERIRFFLRRHGSWDDHWGLYPVYRVN